jgi:hypothetical protein
MSGITNGQYANETAFNDAFMARNGNTNTIGKVGLLNADPASGTSITNLQGFVNDAKDSVDSHIADTSNPHATTKDQVGLSDVTNDAQLRRAASDFATFTEKLSLDDDDWVLVEDSADSFNKKKVKASQVGGGGVAAVAFGSDSAPRQIDALVGITSAAGHIDVLASLNFLVAKGVTASVFAQVTASPAIQNGTIVGQSLVIVGGDDDDMIEIIPAVTVDINGPWQSRKGSSITLYWGGVKWTEVSRRDV